MIYPPSLLGRVIVTCYVSRGLLIPHFESDLNDGYDPFGDTTHTSTLVRSQSTMRLATPYPRHPSHCEFLWT